jgi:multidrug resistance protein
MMLKKIDREFLNFAFSLYIPGFCIRLGWGLVSPIMSLYALSFGVSYALVGMVNTANALGRISTDLPFGALCDRIGRRPLTILGLLIVVVSAMLCGLAQSFYQLIFFRFLMGTGMSMWMIARQAMIADSIDPSVRGRVMSTFQGVNLVGSAAGPTVGGVIAEFWGYRAPFFFYAAVVFASFVIALFLIKETSPKPQIRRHEAKKTRISQISSFLTFSILIAALTNFTTHIRYSSRGILVPLLGDAVLHLTSIQIGLVLTASTISSILVVALGGYIVDRYGRKKALVPSFLLVGLAFSLFPIAANFTDAVLISALYGFASGIGGGATMALAADLAPRGLEGLFMGFWTTIGDVGSAVGPVALGLVADISGIVPSFYVVGAFMFLTAGTTQLFVKETLRKNEKTEDTVED